MAGGAGEGNGPYADVWAGELSGEGGREAWYAKATEYWQAQEATLSGILGGFPETNEPDLRGSRRFLETLRRKVPPLRFGSALDCGAGTGRVAAGLLLDLFERVDLVEQDERLLAAAQRELQGPRVGRFTASSMQQFEPEEDMYDMVWLQWVLMYLPDDDLLKFLRRCTLGLTDTGVICIKENVVLEGNFTIDWDDNSVARLDAQYKAIFGRAGLYVVEEQEQPDWPSQLIPVKMYALRQKPGLRKPVLPRSPEQRDRHEEDERLQVEQQSQPQRQPRPQSQLELQPRSQPQPQLQPQKQRERAKRRQRTSRQQKTM